MAGPEPSKLMMRVRSSSSRSSFLAASNQGDCARLLSGNEPGSIPGLPASMGVSSSSQDSGLQNRQRWCNSSHPRQFVPRAS